MNQRKEWPIYGELLYDEDDNHIIAKIFLVQQPGQIDRYKWRLFNSDYTLLKEGDVLYGHMDSAMDAVREEAECYV